MFKTIRKADIILLVILIILGLGVSFWIYSGAKSGQVAVVKVDGKEYGRYSLNKNRVIHLHQKGHTNEITIKNGYVQMTFSDCHNQNCVHQGPIKDTSQTVVCLPNKVTITILGNGTKEGYDVISN